MEPVLAALEERGLLLKQDPKLHSVVTLLAGEALRESWWGHPRADVIYGVLSGMADHSDILLTKLVAGKVTFVHRRLWPAVLAVGRSRDEWQLLRLPSNARALWMEVERLGALMASGPSARELERRVLVHGEPAQTSRGRLAVWLEAWDRWAERVDCHEVLELYQGKRELEEAVLGIGGAPKSLPWIYGRE